MSDIRQVGPNRWEAPEDMGVTPQFMYTKHAEDHYPDGEKILHEPLHKNRKTSLIAPNEETKDLGEVFEGSSAGGHDGYLDMRVNSVTDRTEIFYMLFIIGPLVWLTFHWLVLSSIEDPIARSVSIYSGYGVFFCSAFWYLFHTLALPVRFHKKNQEVYVYHQEVLYRIPWSDCEFSVQVAKKNQGYRGLQDGYQLTLWLNPVHAVNQDLTGKKHVALNLFHNMDHHIPMYAYWEYVRRYMEGEEPLYIEMDKEPRKPGYNHELAKEEGYIKMTLIFILAGPIFLLLLKPNKLALLSPFKIKWPEEVHEWTGERCDWH
jgi:hypothetical protein